MQSSDNDRIVVAGEIITLHVEKGRMVIEGDNHVEYEFSYHHDDYVAAHGPSHVKVRGVVDSSRSSTPILLDDVEILAWY